MPDQTRFPIRRIGLSAAHSCRSGLTDWQWAILVLFAGVLVALFVTDPGRAYGLLFPVLAAVFWSALGLRGVLLCIGYLYSARPVRSEPAQDQQADRLPVYSVLVPLYREAPVVRQLVRELASLDWPKHLLDVQFLVESDDFETRLEIERVGLPSGMRMTLVPQGGPRTKPNALNFGLIRARGEFVCCFDAEDRPDPGQLTEAYARFRAGPDRLAVLQAPLVGTGRNRDWLAQNWALEYAVAFGLVMPALTVLDVPLPLGGTSNHFRTRILLDIGGWDAWNVTEDADIGVRLARAGYQAGMLSAPTLEAAPVRYAVWLNQRTRWIKGFLMTYAVVMRSPLTLLRELGAWRFLALQMTFGTSTLTHFVHAPAVLLAAFSIWHEDFELGPDGWALFAAGLGIATLADLLAPGKWTPGRILAMLTRPAYWPLQSVAAYRALIELVRRPFYWAKTPHVPEHAEKAATQCLTGSSALPLRPFLSSSESSRSERQTR